MIQDKWNKALEFHGHACPGLAIGVRACNYLTQHRDFSSASYGTLYCITENDACGVDAIQCLLGCSVGKGNLLFKMTGKQAFSFFNKENGKGLRVYLKANKTEEMSREEWQNSILNAPFEDVFTLSEPTIPCPTPAQKFDTILCEICGEGAAEPKIHLQKGKKVCSGCFEPYSRSL